MRIDDELAEVIGIHVGDGCISVNKRYSEYYLGGDLIEEREYHDNWVGPLFNKKIMIPLFNKKVNYKEYPKSGIYGFYIFDKKLVWLFNNLGVPSGPKTNIGIPEQVMNNKKFSLRFLRGLFDTDGNIYFDKNRSAKNPKNDRPTIKLESVSRKLIEQVFKLLVDFGLHPRMKKPYKGKRNKNESYTVLLYRMADIEFFIKNIGFKNPKHSSKWDIYKRISYCPPHTSLEERKIMINSKKAYKDIK